MRVYKVIEAAFEAGETDATYTEKVLNADGVAVSNRTRSGAPSVDLSWAGALLVGVPSGVDAGIDKLRFQVSFDGTTWWDVRNEAGVILEVPDGTESNTIQDVKGDAVLVDLKLFPAGFVKLVPVDNGGSAAAPGAVTFVMGAKE